MSAVNGWKVCELDELAHLDVETLSAGTPKDFQIYYLDISSASEGHLDLPSTEIQFREAPSRARKVVHRQDVLMSMVRPNLKAFAYFDHTDEPCVASTGFAVLTAKEHASAKFLLYAILSENVSRQIDSLVIGSNYPAINSSAVRSLKIPTPPKPEQTKIAEILSTVDRAIEQTEALIAKQQRLKTGLMQDLLTRGIDEHGKLRSEQTHPFKDSPLGRIPVEWEVKPIGQVFEIQLGKMLSQKAAEGISPFPYLGNKNVQWDRVEATGLQMMDFNGRERSKFELRPGDILVCEGGEVGRTCLWRGEVGNCYYQKAIHRLRPVNNEYLPELFPRFMRWGISRGILADFTSQTSIAHLTQEKLATVPIIVPPICDQILIVQSLDSLDAKLVNLDATLHKFRALKTALMQDLLTGRKRVANLLDRKGASA